MTTKYNPEIIQQFADQLYNLASWVVFIWTTLWLFIGGGCTFYIAHKYYAVNDIDKFIIIGSILGACIGYNIGQTKAFSLRFRAQRALCQKQIEENTRRVS